MITRTLQTFALFALMLGTYTAATAITLTSVDRITHYLEVKADKVTDNLNKGKEAYE